MTPAAIVHADASVTEPRVQIRQENRSAQIVECTGNSKLMPMGDRLAPARGVFLGIAAGVALWVALGFLILSHFLGNR